MAYLGLRVITNITKEYPHMFKVVVYREPKYFVKSFAPKRDRDLVSEFDYTPSVSSLNRTKTLVHDIVLCNDFELFCTFTFDPKKVDSFSFPACWRRMSTWLHHQKDRSREKGKDFKYLIVPEKHKSGRWHFHALISGYTSALKRSKCVTSSFRPVYNITSFTGGFTTAVYIDEKEGVANYVSKYITKDFIKMFNQRRFFCSRNLIRPVKTINDDLFSLTLPIFRKKVVQGYETDEYIIDKF